MALPSEIAVYVATHNQQVLNLQDFEIPIQTGAALSPDILAPLRDDLQTNISARNRTFCELTALYWIWKNDTHPITGLSHYRRRFQTSSVDIVRRLKSCDLLIPPPYYFRMTLRKEYEKYHMKEDLDLLIDITCSMDPEIKDPLFHILNNNMLIPYNMMIAPKKLFDDYCQWLFPILFTIEKRITMEQRSPYQQRVFGFMAERLFTVYVYRNNLNFAVCPTAIPETDTLFGKAKYIGGSIFNELYFKWMKRI